jgi:hydrogenase expression/formation protein HypD
MKTLDQIIKLSKKLKKPIALMEVCGTHTVSIFKSGLKALLPKNINLISGPGCPVCVTSATDLDKALALADNPDIILTTFGDMIKVPGSFLSLADKRAESGNIELVYSPIDALEVAKNNPNKKVVFLAVGFETTSPTIAGTIIEADRQNINNFYILCSHKLIPPAMKALLDLGEVKLDGFLCPGHVSTILGSNSYEFISQDYAIPCVISGFDAPDIAESILMVLKQKLEGRSEVEIQYKRVVRPHGNPKAREILAQVFEVVDEEWRGLGIIPQSGYKLRGKYKKYDIEKAIKIKSKTKTKDKGCICGAILRGVNIPTDCKLYAKKCTPENPVGPCMVSTEGTCSAYYKYNRT